MKKYTAIGVFIIIALVTLTAFEHKKIPSFNYVVKEVKIGNQTWMAENLNIDTFQNGDLITEAKTDEEWMRARLNRQAAWCYPKNNPDNGPVYGRLYNWYAVSDKRGLAPKGWKIPTAADWLALENELGKEKVGSKIKSKEGWEKWKNNRNANGSNQSGFNAFPAGWRLIAVDLSNEASTRQSIQFSEFGAAAIWWCSTYDYWGPENDPESIAANYIGVGKTSNIAKFNADPGTGISVRCIKE